MVRLIAVGLLARSSRFRGLGQRLGSAGIARPEGEEVGGLLMNG